MQVLQKLRNQLVTTELTTTDKVPTKVKLPKNTSVDEVTLVETKTEKVKHRAITKLLIEGPVKALAPAIITIGAGTLGFAVAGIPGAIIGGVVGAQVGLATSDKIADIAGEAFDKLIDKGIELAGKGVEFVAKKISDGVSYVGNKIYEKIFPKKPEVKEEVVLLEVQKEGNSSEILDTIFSGNQEEEVSENELSEEEWNNYSDDDLSSPKLLDLPDVPNHIVK